MCHCKTKFKKKRERVIPLLSSDLSLFVEEDVEVLSPMHFHIR